MKFKPKSIKNSLTFTIGLFATLTILALGWVHHYAVRGAVMKQVYKTQLITDLKAHQSELLITLEKAIETSEALADDPALTEWFTSVKVNPKTKEIALKKLDYIHKELGYPTIFAVNNSTNEYWCENFKLLDIVTEEDPDDSWFFTTIRSQRKSTLNFDSNSILNQTMLFVNVLMGSPDAPIGVAGVGINPSVLIEQFKKNKPSENAHLWLVDNKGKILLSERTNEINKNLYALFDQDVVSGLLSGSREQIIREVNFRNEKYELASMLMGSTDYRVVMVIPQDDLLGIVNVIAINTIWLTILVFILTIVISTLLAKNISRPIEHLALLTKRIADSKLNSPVKNKLIERDDEIGHLAKEFDSMQKQLSLTISRLNKANADLENDKIQLKSINKELKTAMEKASESEKLTKAFMANISHEIRTPMNSIMGFAQLLENELQDDEILKNYSGIIIENGNQLLAILNSIIEVAKMDSGITKPHLVRFPVNKVISECMGFFSYSTRNNVNLVNACENKEETTITSDILLLKRILNNLISNAIKYTSEGTVEVKFRIENDTILFQVSDTGIGISTKDQASIFKPFWQVSNDSSINDGAGLGLAISKKMVEILGGEIWVESEPGVGSDFYFTLPHKKS
ncbi:ATP-binding protein [Carboxylicivirga sp. RSCT41]|uniref:sensor histidine kinase n=1 Tax=Carboxylicivirga agarovorans TaxID=3417570 RepID=UPI003D333F99